MTLKTPLTITGLTLLFAAAVMNDGLSPFMWIFVVVGVAIPMLIAADLLHRKEKQRREEEEQWF